MNGIVAFVGIIVVIIEPESHFLPPRIAANTIIIIKKMANKAARTPIIILYLEKMAYEFSL
jgi:hypothetical protein